MIIQGDARHLPLKAESIQCCIPSPPYYGLRDYGIDGQIGLEKTPEEYTANMVQVFREVWRVLKKDGTVWLNLGDSYNGSGGYGGDNTPSVLNGSKQTTNVGSKKIIAFKVLGLKPKDLIGIPWRVAFALQADGWWLRQDIIWHKPNPMPESVRDRCTKSHEYLFLLTKSAKYYYDADAIKTPIKDSSVARLIQDVENQRGSDRLPLKTNGNMKAVKFGGNKQCPDTRLQSGKEWNPKMAGGGSSYKDGHSGYFDKDGNPLCGVVANKKSVWSITTQGFKGAHFAVMPEALVEPCILAGSKPGDVVIDPFGGSMTVGKVAERHLRQFIGIDLNMEYIAIGKKRLHKNQLKLI
jgi:DNA modification methylase